MTRLFISHGPQDAAFVRELRAALELHGVSGREDFLELADRNLPWPATQQAVDAASAYLVVVSPASLQSEQLANELAYALEVQKQRGKAEFPVVPLSLDGTGLGVLRRLFGEEPVCVPVSSAPGGIDAAVDAILAALGKRLPVDVAASPQPIAEPLEELVLHLTDLKIRDEAGERRASARAQLVYQPAAPGQPAVSTARTWRFDAPLGPIEAGELRWYLEKYALWPGGPFRARARKVEGNLVRWGRLLYEGALPSAHTVNVMQAWAGIDDHADRRFSVYVDAALDAGASDTEAATVREAATALLGLPWELLHDGARYLFQGARPTRVRRRLPNTRVRGVPVVALPIRILLVTARPEDGACRYLDYRVSALPLVEAMEALPGLVHIHVLNPPTLPALRAELERARRAREPYHVVHFDGHGVFNRQMGLGGLCFEDPSDVGKLEERRHLTVYTDELGPLLLDYRVPLVFLEACQTAQGENASGSVASALLEAGVASVVAMSHSVLVETSRRFVEAFYAALARGARVGDATLEGQRRLKDDRSRAWFFGEGEQRLEDWFVPVLFQERDDPQLFRTTPSRQTREDFAEGLRVRFGELLPPEPETGFIGRSRELLALQRLLRQGSYAVVRGQGGEGKTALAAELARWMVRSHQVRRAAFVSVETHSNAVAVLDAIGRQLVPGYSAALYDGLEKALLPVERALAEQPTLLVVDNMESILPPPFMAAETPDALAEDAQAELDAILELCVRLNRKGDTRLVFTSREALPAPFDAARHRRELRRLDIDDAVRLVKRTLNASGKGDAAAVSDAALEEIEQLVQSVHCHARTLTLLAPSLRSHGAEATRTSLVELMTEMERTFPGSREKSVFASVELSLRRLSRADRDRAGVLGVFHGGVTLDVLRTMMEWEEADVASLADALVRTGLATHDPYGHLTLNPALCPYLRARMDAAERTALMARWTRAMQGHAEFLRRQQHRNTALAATLTLLELPNLFALLDQVQRAGDAEATIDLVTSLYGLLLVLGKPRLLRRVARVRDAAEAALGASWNHARFEAQRTRIKQLLHDGCLREGCEGARHLLQRMRHAGESAYPHAEYDLAQATFALAQALTTAESAEEALSLLDEAQRRFDAIGTGRGGAAAGMAAACFSERGECLLKLGRRDEAAAAYEESIRRAEELGNDRQVAVGTAQLGFVRMDQGRYPEALEAYAEARERFTRLSEPGSVAVTWHQTGIAYQETDQPEAAEDAFRNALACFVQLGDVASQARTLGQLGMLYDNALGRTGEAVDCLRQAVDKSIEISDVAGEGKNRSNLAIRLRKLRRLDEARQETQRALACGAPFGHAFEPWRSWDVLAGIETDAGNPAAAADAKQRALACYLAYRRDGGENSYTVGRIAFAVSRALDAGEPVEAASLLEQIAATPEASMLSPFVQALRAIIDGSRDRALADAPELHYTMAAEILFLLEALESRHT